MSVDDNAYGDLIKAQVGAVKPVVMMMTSTIIDVCSVIVDQLTAQVGAVKTGVCNYLYGRDVKVI